MGESGWGKGDGERGRGMGKWRGKGNRESGGRSGRGKGEGEIGGRKGRGKGRGTGEGEKGGEKERRKVEKGTRKIKTNTCKSNCFHQDYPPWTGEYLI